MAITLQRIHPFEGAYSRSLFGASGTLYIVNSLGQVTVSDADAPLLLTRGWAPVDPGSGTSYQVVDFGAFPGSNFAQTTIQDAAPADAAGLILVQAMPVATADHSADEHAVDGPLVSGTPDGNGNIIINAYPNNNVPKVDNMMPWGKWTVGWCFLQ